MDTGQVDVLSRHPVPQHRLTVRDYHRLGEAGIRSPVHGAVQSATYRPIVLRAVLPDRPRRGDALNELLVTAVARRASVRVQNPIVLDDESEPQPDFTLVGRPGRG